ncbi:putative ISRm10-1 transposase [Agrobacterium tumefaciens F2]|jgi:hypothetical protein|nr:putative ISRm10-1 transposase [Agrobacterium tumefaciens F2]
MTPAKQGRRGGSRLDINEDFIVGLTEEKKDITLTKSFCGWPKRRRSPSAAAVSMSGCASAAGLSKKTAHELEHERPDLLKRRRN